MSEQLRYYILDNGNDAEILRKEAKRLSFPLSEEDLRDIKLVEAKYDSEENCSGLAAPQFGISKAFMVFATPDDESFKKFRPDWTDSMPKSIWINPSYEGIENAGKHSDWEACFSVVGIAGFVPRYNKINYTAFDMEGNLISGSCEGFLARIIQHETDHLNGILFVDKAVPGTVMTIDAYRKMRAEALAAEESDGNTKTHSN